MSKESRSGCVIRQATIEDVVAVANNLIEPAVHEMRRAEINPALQLFRDFKTYTTYVALAPDDKPMGLFGVNKEGNAWMQKTNKIYEYPRYFVQAFKTWLKSQPHPLLYNYVDIQHTKELTLLKKLGFKFLRVIPMTKNNNYYVEFVRLWIQ